MMNQDGMAKPNSVRWKPVSFLLAGTALILGGLAFAQVKLEPPGPSVWEKPIAPGFVYREEIDYKAHRSIHELRLSLNSPAVRACSELFGHTTYEQGSVTSRGPVSGMVSSAGAIAGINGDFFSMAKTQSGDPLGLTVRDGTILSTPSKRVAFGWGPHDVSVGVARFTGTVRTSAGNSLKIDGLNRKCTENSIVLDTEDAGLALAEEPCVSAVIKFDNPVWAPSTVLRGTIEAISADQGSIPVEKRHAVLVARGDKAASLSALTAGSQLTIDIQTTGFDWERIDNVIGGGPRLLENGQIAVDGSQEGFQAEFTEAKHPRTAIGKTKAGDLWFVAVDGRQETGDGMSLFELANHMLKLGCVDAINLDGGGSTTMNVLGVTVNRPSDGQERAVADGVIFLGPKPKPMEEKLKLVCPPSLTVGFPGHAEILDESRRAIPSIQVVWGCQGACAVDQSGNLKALQPGKAILAAFARGHLLTTQIAVSKPEVSN